MRRLAVLPLALVAALAPAAAAAEAAPKSLLINPSANVPPTVTPERFRELGVRAAGGWRLSIAGETPRQSGRQDGVNTLGFSPILAADVAGVYEAWGDRTVVRRCRRVRGRRVCRRVSRTRIVEGDVSMNSNLPWQQGPAYPTMDQADLETVMIHELGHFAAPTAPHRRGCVNSPLVDTVSPGDWWRGPTDWFRRGCPNSPGTPPAAQRFSPRELRVAGKPYKLKVIVHQAR